MNNPHLSALNKSEAMSSLFSPRRSELETYLFKPNFQALLQTLFQVKDLKGAKRRDHYGNFFFFPQRAQLSSKYWDLPVVTRGDMRNLPGVV